MLDQTADPVSGNFKKESDNMIKREETEMDEYTIEFLPEDKKIGNQFIVHIIQSTKTSGHWDDTPKVTWLKAYYVTAPTRSAARKCAIQRYYRETMGSRKARKCEW